MAAEKSAHAQTHIWLKYVHANKRWFVSCNDIEVHHKRIYTFLGMTYRVMWSLHFKWKCCVWKEETKYILCHLKKNIEQLFFDSNQTKCNLLKKKWNLCKIICILPKVYKKCFYFCQKKKNCTETGNTSTTACKTEVIGRLPAAAPPPSPAWTSWGQQEVKIKFNGPRIAVRSSLTAAAHSSGRAGGRGGRPSALIAVAQVSSRVVVQLFTPAGGT